MCATDQSVSRKGASSFFESFGFRSGYSTRNVSVGFLLLVWYAIQRGPMQWAWGCVELRYPVIRAKN